jgi:hypothetical protein
MCDHCVVPRREAGRQRRRFSCPDPRTQHRVQIHVHAHPRSRRSRYSIDDDEVRCVTERLLFTICPIVNVTERVSHPSQVARGSAFADFQISAIGRRRCPLRAGPAVSVPGGIGANRTDAPRRRLLQFAPSTPPGQRQVRNEEVKSSDMTI